METEAAAEIEHAIVLGGGARAATSPGAAAAAQHRLVASGGTAARPSIAPRWKIATRTLRRAAADPESPSPRARGTADPRSSPRREQQAHTARLEERSPVDHRCLLVAIRSSPLELGRAEDQADHGVDAALVGGCLARGRRAGGASAISSSSAGSVRRVVPASPSPSAIAPPHPAGGGRSTSGRRALDARRRARDRAPPAPIRATFARHRARAAAAPRRSRARPPATPVRARR